LSAPLAIVNRGSAEAVVVLMDLDELVDHWTLLKDERELAAGKRGPTRLGFALLLKFYARAGRFPRGRAELDDDAVAFVARQVGVPASDLGFYEWSGSTIEYHRAQIRRHLGFLVCTAEDAGKLTAWPAASVCQAERRADRVREELLARCRAEQIEPPSAGRCDRIIRSALHQAEQAMTARVTGRLGPDASARLAALAAAADDDDADGADPSALALIKSVPGNVSLESMLTEIAKLDAARAAGLPDGLFSGIAPKVVTAWRARAAVEAPSHLRDHPRPLMLTLLAALVHERQREITDTLADLLISTVHRIGARAERRVTQELVSEFRKVAGKETLLFRLAEAAIARPDDTVRAVVYPVAGEKTLRDLVAEYKSSLIDMLKEAVLRTGCLTAATSAAARGDLDPGVLAQRLLLAVYAYGTNTGIRAVAAGEHGHSEDDIRYVRRRYLSPESARAMAVEIANATFAARHQAIWGTGSTAVASDSTHFGAFDQNIFTEWHARYGTGGVLIYWHVERKSMAIHSQLIGCSASEVAAMIEGVMRHGTRWRWRPVTQTPMASPRSGSASPGCSASTCCPGSSGSTRPGCTARQREPSAPGRGWNPR
jgi:hypothetical protein